ncbi:MAG: NAD(P)-binding domain-containing protein [Pseudomonadota bacterium]
MKSVTTIIIGAGQAGLAASKQLSDRGIDHIVLERGSIGNSWKTERWDSLRLLTPNWQSRLPGYFYDGPEPDGYMNMSEVVSYLESYSRVIDAPIQDNTNVISVERRFERYIVKTTRGTWASSTLVLANGACSLASIPKFADAVPQSIRQMSPLEYKNPDQLESGGVLIVGASATGVQLAREIQQSGRQVTLSVGEHIRVPRTYRGKDIKWWMDVLGLLDIMYHEVEDLNRVRKLSSLQLAGTQDCMFDLNSLSDCGVEITGRLAAMRGEHAIFSGSLANVCSLADLKMNRLLESIDQCVEANAGTEVTIPPRTFEPTRVPEAPALNIDFGDRKIKTVIWATGFKPDYSWLHLPVFDRKGNIRHEGGIVDAPGLYVLGLPFLRKRKSTLIDGAGDDAGFVASHLASSLRKAAA